MNPGKTILTAVICLVTLAGYSQDKPDLPACVILSAGVNLNALETADTYFSLDANPGFSGGATIRSDGDIYVTGGFQYASINPTLTSKTSGESDQVNMQYFQIPLMVGAHVFKSKDALQCLHAQLGGSFGFLMDVSENDLGIIRADIKNNGFYFKGGIGADLWMFVADIHYNLLVNHLYNDAGYNNKSRLICWEFTIGYKINLHKKDSAAE